MKTFIQLIFAAALTARMIVHAQVPAVLNYQGRILVDGLAFEGIGQFKFALVNADVSETFWRNSPDANNDGEPDDSVSVTVARGLYSVLLGDTSIPNMGALPNSLFTNRAIYLRVWFGNGSGALKRLEPDQRMAAVGYALMAANVPDESITLGKLAPDSRGAIDDAAGEITSLKARADSLQSQIDSLSGRLSSLIAVSTDPADSALVGQGFQQFYSISSPSWVNGAASLSARKAHTAVWTGQRMIVWGGLAGSGTVLGSGGTYDPLLDQWTAVSLVDSPTARSGHTAVWTGREMIVWGGYSTTYQNSGGRFSPANQNWSSTSFASAPEPRENHCAVWTDAGMLIFGGRNSTGRVASASLYSPTLNSWTDVSLPNAPEPRTGASSVWTGERALIWGGTASANLNSGGQLLFVGGASTEWTVISSDSAPSARSGHTAIWTGSQMIIWGGRNGDSYMNDGAAFDPVSNTWTSIPTTGAPGPRANHCAVWTGREMLIVGGEDASGEIASGAAYDPEALSWRPLSSSGGPVPRTGSTAVWSGSEVIIFGGKSATIPIAALQRLNPQPNWHFFRKL